MRPSTGGCGEGLLCFEVHADVIGSVDGEGTCAVFGPGDPDDLEPLATNPGIVMRPGTTAVWAVALRDSPHRLPDLNAVCSPMVEG